MHRYKGELASDDFLSLRDDSNTFSTYNDTFHDIALISSLIQCIINVLLQLPTQPPCGEFELSKLSKHTLVHLFDTGICDQMFYVRLAELVVSQDFTAFTAVITTLALDCCGQTPTSAVYLQQMKQKMSRVNPFTCLLYTSPSPRDGLLSRMPSSA